MASSNNKYTQTPQAENETFPFETAEEVWFWFIQAQEARSTGARIAAGKGLFTRPCEPVDILKILDRLYRQRRLLRDHLLVLRHYGRRHLPPDPRRIKEAKAYKIWVEALECMTPSFERKGIIRKSQDFPFQPWTSKINSLQGALRG